MEKKPRPHAEIIKEWADGKEVQYRAPGSDAWVDCPDPAWTVDYEYRVKPAREYPESKLEDGHICAMYEWFNAHPLQISRMRDNATVAIRHAIDNGQVVLASELQDAHALAKKQMDDLIARVARFMAVTHRPADKVRLTESECNTLVKAIAKDIESKCRTTPQRDNSEGVKG